MTTPPPRRLSARRAPGAAGRPSAGPRPLAAAPGGRRGPTRPARGPGARHRRRARPPPRPPSARRSFSRRRAWSRAAAARACSCFRAASLLARVDPLRRDRGGLGLRRAAALTRRAPGGGPAAPARRPRDEHRLEPAEAAGRVLARDAPGHHLLQDAGVHRRRVQRRPDLLGRGPAGGRRRRGERIDRGPGPVGRLPQRRRVAPGQELLLGGAEQLCGLPERAGRRRGRAPRRSRPRRPASAWPGP